MAGAVASLFKRMGFWGVVNAVSIGSLPVLAYLCGQQEKQLAWLDEQEKRVIASMIARGIVRERWGLQIFHKYVFFWKN